MTEKKTGKDAFFWLGILIAVVVGFDIFANFGDWTELVWFCTVAATALSWALFRKDALVMTVCLVLSIPAQTPWVFDFVLTLLGHGMGRTEMLRETSPLIFWGSIVIHTIVVPVSAWGVWKLGFSRKALWPAFISGACLLLASFLFTLPYKNVNCVFYPCDADDPGSGYVEYFLFRSIVMWAVIVPASYFILRWVFQGRVSSQGQHADNA